VLASPNRIEESHAHCLIRILLIEEIPRIFKRRLIRSPLSAAKSSRFSCATSSLSITSLAIASCNFRSKLCLVPSLECLCCPLELDVHEPHGVIGVSRRLPSHLHHLVKPLHARPERLEPEGATSWEIRCPEEQQGTVVRDGRRQRLQNRRREHI
jgi:hypothetical protein